MFVTRKEALIVAVAAMTLSAGIASGCSLITSYDEFTPAPSAGCGTEIPHPPSSSYTGGDKRLVGTTRTIRFGAEAGKSMLGYDLDGLCTCSGSETPACTNKHAGEQGGDGRQCDQPAATGIDNATGVLLSALNLDTTMSSVLNTSFQQGKSGMLVEVRNYNGQVDDSDVSVTLYNVVGVNGKTDGSGAALFDGTDKMIVDNGSFMANHVSPVDLPNYTDAQAYVVDGTLVANIPFSLRLEIPNSLPGGSNVVSVTFTQATLVGKITVKGDGGLLMPDAQLVGRIAAKDIFAQLPLLGLCQNTGFFAPKFPEAKAKTCGSLDLPLTHGEDGTKVACGALSLAIGVEVSAAQFDPKDHAPAKQTPSLCGPEPNATCD